MSNTLEQVRFDIQDVGLVISGPQKFITQTCVDEFDADLDYPFEFLIDEETSVATWRLGPSVAAGMIGDEQTQNDAMRRVNNYIANIAYGVSDHVVAGDPDISSLVYHPDIRQFEIAAEVKKPTLSHEAVQAVVEQNVLAMAHDLGGLEDEPRIEVLQNGGSGAVSGLNMSIEGSSVKAFDFHAGSFEARGRGVQYGKQPLLYLTGLVAMARADELVSK